MHKLKQSYRLLIVALGLFISFNGIHDMNAATTWLEFVRGLFWMLTGTASFVISWDHFKDNRRKK